MRTRPLLHALAGAVLVAGLVACTGPDDSEPRVAGTAEVASPSTSASPVATDVPDAQGDAAAAGDDAGAGDAVAQPAPGELPTAPPVDIADEADFGTGVTAEITQVEAIEGEGRGLGERSGPALVFELEVTNGSSGPVDMGTVTVNLADATGAPAAPLSGPPAAPFSRSVEPGGTAVGTYVFLVPPAARDQVTLEVAYTTEAPVVVFAGDPDGVRPRS
ncbi:conserved hypothetical protein [Cellulomonas flavigena DSM 20109]|uniref:DUF4352 domain-containing protein n=1 Tax=Cellulomonas flavigena (strain ATCC 482 / DSM 20109 / BCRC 11376 / JCM 18109 / NBRC 3775 / NCIMB 8073 / NRS 134) TaxID=446466 RepID=D5UK56_CELFN|nr:hypothetical protein [Cellulomonas flavigena]ADG73798.1 conserved hypothetical protein [Cellulomonas flavigena DSM 20109]